MGLGDYFFSNDIPVLGDDGVAQHIDLLVTTLEAVVLRLGLGYAGAGLLFLQNLSHLGDCCGG